MHLEAALGSALMTTMGPSEQTITVLTRARDAAVSVDEVDVQLRVLLTLAGAQAPRLLVEEIGIDTFLHTVSPMDRHGYFSFGTGNDYSTKVARVAKRLIVEVNQNMPRVHRDGAELHISEVDAIVENNVPLIGLPFRGPGPEDELISRTIAGLVPDGPVCKWVSAHCQTSCVALSATVMTSASTRRP